jgi:hypothetical protein
MRPHRRPSAKYVPQVQNDVHYHLRPAAASAQYYAGENGLNPAYYDGSVYPNEEHASTRGLHRLWNYFRGHPPQQEPATVRVGCINEETFMGTDIKDIPAQRFYRAHTGNCFDVHEDLFPYLKLGKTTDPYTGVPLWRSQSEKNELLNHKGFSKEERSMLFAIFSNLAIDRDIEAVLLRNVPVLRQIGLTGLLAYGDFGEENGFQVSTEALVELYNTVHSSPDAEVLLNISALPLGSRPLKDIIERQGTSCIHGIGHELIKFYLSYYKELRGDVGTLLRGFIPLGENIIVFPVFSRTLKRLTTGLYIHSETTHGRDSKTANIGFVEYTKQELLWEPIGNASSFLDHADERETSIFEMAIDEMWRRVFERDNEDFIPNMIFQIIPMSMQRYHYIYDNMHSAPLNDDRIVEVSG